MDKSWVHLNRRSKEYRDAARKFVDRSRLSVGNADKIICPCIKCKSVRSFHFEVVYEHLVKKGMNPDYEAWVLHGENPSVNEECENIEMTDSYRMYKDAYDQDYRNGEREEDFLQKLEAAESPLYEGCKKYTRLTATVVLYKLKAVHSLSDVGFTEFLECFQDMLPENNILLSSLYSTKKLLKTFDLGYEKIDACPRDCCLFRKENQDLEACPHCGCLRWKLNQRTNKIEKGVPAKVLRYFPIIPRFKRMFKSEKEAEQFTWHSRNQSQDGKMRHPCDSPAWKSINRKWPEFGSEARNLRLGLATDGFNLFRDLSSRYSCWPVILVNYNLPPWLCMLKEHLMLTLLIPGPKQPGNDIDVYLEPLIEELQ